MSSFRCRAPLFAILVGALLAICPSTSAKEPVRPAAAYYSAELKEFLLPYEEVRQAAAPDIALLDFMQSTYEAGAKRAGWLRAELERAT